MRTGSGGHPDADGVPDRPGALATRPDLDAYAANTDRLGLALRDLTSGKDFEFRGDYSNQSASMAKVMIVAMALRKAAADGGELPFERMTQASNAIIHSDNDSADALWAYAGGPDAYQVLANELGMTQTHRDPDKDFGAGRGRRRPTSAC